MACSRCTLPFHVLISVTGSFPFHGDDEQRFDFYGILEREREGGGCFRVMWGLCLEYLCEAILALDIVFRWQELVQ